MQRPAARVGGDAGACHAQVVNTAPTRGWPRRIAGPLADRRTWSAFGYLLSGGLLSAVWFGLLLVGWLAVALLSVTPLAVPVAIAFRAATAFARTVEAAIARRLLHVELSPPRPRPVRPGFWGRALDVALDESFWRAQAFLVIRTVAGFVLAVGAAAGLAVAVGLIAAPAYYWAPGAGPDTGSWEVDSLPRALAVVPVGLVALYVWGHAVRGLGTLHVYLARTLLGPVDPPTPAAARARRLGFVVVHAIASTVLNALLVVVWAATSASSFWPVWSLLPCALLLALHGGIVAVLGSTRPRSRAVQGVGIHAVAAVSLSLFLVAIWAVTGRTAFWPGWAMLGLAIPLAIHWLAVRVGGSRAALNRRIDELTVSRAGAVDVAETDLGRIERDIHDGAQARLVALGMSLGMAEQKLGADPEAARALVAEARLGVGVALEELRDLARGIRPPILADRGLVAAVESLADVSALPVHVSSTAAGRVAPNVEAAAYFVVSEAIANAAKHGGASRVDVVVERTAETLSVRITDDGNGGADETGSGLTGLRRRLEALDGRLTVASPPGGPTTVQAVIPCAS